MDSSHLQNKFLNTAYEYCIIGGGPAGICAVAKLLERKYNPNTILWIDPSFSAGGFGKEWANVPGNTSVESYQNVNTRIDQILSFYENKRQQEQQSHFEIDKLPSHQTCFLNVASEPMKAFTQRMLKIVCHQKNQAKIISRSNKGWAISLDTNDILFSKRIILATGAKSKRIDLPKKEGQHIKILQIEEVIDKNFLQFRASEITKIAVIGSSHTAALATMNLLQQGVKVCQFMNSPYKFAQQILFNGEKRVLFDNTGLKGDVAEFTKQLLIDGQERFKNSMNFYDSTHYNLKKELPKCSHLVFAVGFETNNTIKIEDYQLGLSHDSQTSIIRDGLFGIGIGYPLKQQSCGIQEFQVGYGKFWSTINEQILEIWHSYPMARPQELKCQAKQTQKYKNTINKMKPML